MKYIIIILLLYGCGQKVNHKVSGKAEVEADVTTNSAIWISYRKMYEEWVFICQDNFNVDSQEFIDCKKDAMKRLTNMLTLDKNL